MISLTFIVTLVIFVYVFGKWYSKIETYYLDPDSLTHEVIFRGKVKQQSYGLDTIDFIYFERITKSTGSSSSTTSYYLKVHRKTEEETDTKPKLLFKADSKRVPMILDFLRILQKHRFRVEIQKGFKSRLIRDGKWEEGQEKEIQNENICPGCNTPNPLDATFCETCGDAFRS